MVEKPPAQGYNEGYGYCISRCEADPIKENECNVVDEERQYGGFDRLPPNRDVIA
jgi:hypothetical protein